MFFRKKEKKSFSNQEIQKKEILLQDELVNIN